MNGAKYPAILITAQSVPHPESGNNIIVRDLYGSGVISAGGLPLAVFYDTRRAEAYAGLFDGLLLTGGGDVLPSRYGQEAGSPVLDISPERDELEFSLLDAFLRQKKPVFGICRGFQLINVAFGGTLLQRIPGDAHWKKRHSVSLKTDFFPLNKSSIEVNSVHRQAVGALGTGLNVWAEASDGVIEGIFHKSLPVFAVQWHPERMSEEKNGETRLLFKKFLDMC